MLRFEELTLDAWGRRFVDRQTLLLPAKAKVGLVGRNGVGKSTLFRLIKGELTPSGGSVSLPRGARMGAVDQEHPATPTPLLETVLAADVERASLLERLETAPPEEMADIWGRLDEIGADRAPARAAEILAGLGFTEADLARPMAEFSGGWRMRVAMAAALFAEPDLLLLDEPTNYLDLEGALWLEARLAAYPRMVFVISHDRDLLDQSVDHILHLHDGRLDLYRGNLSSFERQRSETLRLQSATREKIEARREHLQSFVDRFRAKASKARQAQSRLKMIAKLGETAPVVEDDPIPFHLPSPERPLAPPLLRLEKVAVGYGGAPVLRNLDLRLDPDDRIGLLGVNGSGKSTFAKLLAGELTPAEGELRRASRIKVGWFHQHQIEALDPNDTPLDIIRQRLPQATEAQRRSRIAQFGFSAMKVETKVADLSGGERARLLLNLVAMERPHLLILDEPTNHLDIDSRRALSEALNDYEGAVVLIAHDRSLMEMVADRLWLTSAGTIRPYDGDMDEYARLVVSRAGRASAAPAAKRPTENRSNDPAPGLVGLRRKLEAAEAKLARQTRAVAEIEAELAQPTLQREPARYAALAQRLTAGQARLAEAEAEWMALAEACEEAQRA